MTPATLWFRLNEKNEYEYNHLENGHCTNERPTPICDEHKQAWKKGKWRADHVFLTDDVPAKVVKQ